jgi:hypothetical protein
MSKQKITIPITENDVEQFKELVFELASDMEWVFESDKGVQIHVTFVNEMKQEED